MKKRILYGYQMADRETYGYAMTATSLRKKLRGKQVAAVVRHKITKRRNHQEIVYVCPRRYNLLNGIVMEHAGLDRIKLQNIPSFVLNIPEGGASFTTSS